MYVTANEKTQIQTESRKLFPLSTNNERANQRPKSCQRRIKVESPKQLAKQRIYNKKPKLITFTTQLNKKR